MDSEETHESTIARGAGFVLVATVISTGVGFLIRAFLIRHLPPADYGLFALALTVGLGSTTLATLGLRQGVARTVAQCDTETEVRDVTLTAMTSTFAVSLLFSFLLVVFPDPIANAILREPELAPYLPVLGALVPGTTIQTVLIATFRGKKRVHERIVVRNLVSPVLRLLLVVAVTLLGYGAYGAIVAWTAGIVLSTALGVVYLHRRTTTFTLAPFEPRYRTLLLFSLPLMVSSAMWTAVQQADNLLLGYFGTSVDVGVYDSSFLLARLLLMVLGAFGFLFMPVFSELEAAGDVDRMHDVYNSVTEWGVLLVLPVFVAIVLSPRAILTTVFRESYAAGALPLLFVASGFFVHVLSGSCGDALVALGRTRVVMSGNVGAGALNVALNLVLIPRYGIVGAAAASAVAYALFNLYYLSWLYRETGILPFTRQFLRPLLASTVLVAAVWVVTNRLLELSVVSLVAVVAVTYLLHAAVVLKTKRLTPGDEQLLSKLERKLGVDVRGAFGP